MSCNVTGVAESALGDENGARAITLERLRLQTFPCSLKNFFVTRRDKLYTKISVRNRSVKVYR